MNTWRGGGVLVRGKLLKLGGGGQNVLEILGGGGGAVVAWGSALVFRHSAQSKIFSTFLLPIRGVIQIQQKCADSTTTYDFEYKTGRFYHITCSLSMPTSDCVMLSKDLGLPCRFKNRVRAPLGLKIGKNTWINVKTSDVVKSTRSQKI